MQVPTADAATRSGLGPAPPYGIGLLYTQSEMMQKETDQ